MQNVLSDIVKELRPGAELDEILARNVMGWDQVMGPENVHWWYTLSRTATGQPIATPNIKVSDWRPSEDNAQAILVLESCEPGISRDAAGNYTSTSLRKYGSGWTVVLDENMMCATQEVSAPTFALAVARAAVAWALRRELEVESIGRHQDPHPITVSGKPVSQQIIEERR